MTALPSDMRSVVVRLMGSVWPFIIGSATGPRSMRQSSDDGLAGRGAVLRLNGLRMLSTL